MQVISWNLCWGDVIGSLAMEDRLEEGMATHSIVVAWRIPGTEEPDGLYIVLRVSKGRTQLGN